MQNHPLENFYTVGVSFKNSGKVYTYKAAKDIKLEVEDCVIVQTVYGFEIVDVVRVDEDASGIDLSLNCKYKFIVQKIDLTQYNELSAKDISTAKLLDV